MPASPPVGPSLVYVADLEHPEIDDADRHHLERVLRVRVDAPITISDGRGRWRSARMGPIIRSDGDIVSVVATHSPLTVAFALVKGSKPELVVQKLTEVGIDVIVAFVAERSVVRWDDDKSDRALRRWQAVAREAGMQSRRSRLVEINPVSTFDDVVTLGGVHADMGGRPVGVADRCVLVGPEGGWSAAERERLGTPVTLGPHVLRAETAAIVAGSLLVNYRS